MYPNVHNITVYSSQDMEATQMSINIEWTKKMWYIYIYTMEVLPSLKNDEFLPSAATWMDLENIMLGEVNQGKTDII